MTRSAAYNVLGAATAAGVTFTVSPAGKLLVSGPPHVLTPDVVAFLKPHKPALLALLTRRPVPSHVPGIVWDPRGGVRVDDPFLYHLTEADPDDRETSREVMDAQACDRQAEVEAEDERAFFALSWEDRAHA